MPQRRSSSLARRRARRRPAAPTRPSRTRARARAAGYGAASAGRGEKGGQTSRPRSGPGTRGRRAGSQGGQSGPRRRPRLRGCRPPTRPRSRQGRARARKATATKGSTARRSALFPAVGPRGTAWASSPTARFAPAGSRTPEPARPTPNQGSAPSGTPVADAGSANTRERTHAPRRPSATRTWREGGGGPPSRRGRKWTPTPSTIDPAQPKSRAWPFARAAVGHQAPSENPSAAAAKRAPPRPNPAVAATPIASQTNGRQSAAVRLTARAPGHRRPAGHPGGDVWLGGGRRGGGGR